MTFTRRGMPFLTLAIALVAAAGAARCSNSPTAPTVTAAAVSGVTADTNNVAAGGTAEGTVRLTLAASGAGSTVLLSSSNPAAVTVPVNVMVPAGSSAATFTATAVAVGTATIRASLDTSSQSFVLNVTALPVALSAIRLSAPSVVGGSSLTGTVLLTAAAPAGGAVVQLSSEDPANVPSNVIVPAGSSSAPFTVGTRAVHGTTTATVSASYEGVSASIVFSVTLSKFAIASFGVTGTAETETCTLTNGGNTLACTFDGGTSTAPGTIIAWNWSYGTANTRTQTTSGPVLTMPTFACSLIPSPPLPAGASSFPLIVKLTIRDDLGNVSAELVHESRVLPQGACGF